ncbi:hypothetical protein BDQ17DRAFT_231948 [Cyathus striatus]|nr:hypothetical protein BDQ17DRAFT_231948 [Cyathus striatus]
MISSMVNAPLAKFDEIPNEILIKIVELVATLKPSESDKTYNIEDVKALSQTCSRLLPFCRKHLFQYATFIIDFNDPIGRKHNEIWNSLPVIKHYPHIAVYIRSLTIRSKLQSGKVKLRKWNVAQLRGFLSKLKNLKEMRLLSLTYEYAPPCSALTRALRNCVLSNPIRQLYIADTIYFPMDALCLIPDLSNLVIRECRSPGTLQISLESDCSSPAKICSSIPLIKRFVRKPQDKLKYMQFPSTIRQPPDDLQPTLEKLEISTSTYAQNGSTICSWILDKRPFNLCALTELHIALASPDDVRTVWNIVLVCSNTLQILLISGQDNLYRS